MGRPKNSISDFIVDPACRPFQGSLHDVAVVGNGPLSEDQRKEISQKDLVVRHDTRQPVRVRASKLLSWSCDEAETANAGSTF